MINTGKIIKISCSLLIAINLFTGTAYADQLVSTKNTTYNGKPAVVQKWVTKVTEDIHGNISKDTKLIFTTNNGDGTKSVYTVDDMDIVDTDYLWSLKNTENWNGSMFVYTYVPASDGTPQYINDNRNLYNHIKGDGGLVIVDEGKPTPTQSTKPSTQAPKTSTTTTKPSTTKPQGSTQGSVQAPVKQSVPDLIADVKSAKSNTTIVVNLTFKPYKGKLTRAGYNITSDTAAPADMHYLKGPIYISGEGTYYLHYAVEDDAGGVNIGYYGPYIIDSSYVAPVTQALLTKRDMDSTLPHNMITKDDLLAGYDGNYVCAMPAEEKAKYEVVLNDSLMGRLWKMFISMLHGWFK